ncbi:HipA Toxin module HipA, protein kinase of phosphatidylinositol 3/4-kinase superfamily [Burkholderiales bacterium]
MQTSCTLELFIDQRWQSVATARLLGETRLGWRAAVRCDYSAAWTLAHFGRRDAYSVSTSWPVGLDGFASSHWPGFLVDLLPQGFGRQHLIQRLGYPSDPEGRVDWQLLCSGAGNPIGNLRVREAADWLSSQPRLERGFTDEDLSSLSEEFLEAAASTAFLAAGSSGVQGEWPKLLLTRAHDGLLYLDHELPDHSAAEHFIVKLQLSSNAARSTILQQEAVYSNIAQHLGLRVHKPAVHRGRALFIARFDRQVQGSLVHRLAQESVASLTQRTGFEQLPSHNEVCAALVKYASNPANEVTEYLLRDVANVALGNKDNHARNTAIQRDALGGVRLTPLFDFAPMLIHPDGLARRMRWNDEKQGKPDWRLVVEQLSPLVDPRGLKNALQLMAPRLEEVMRHGLEMGLSPDLMPLLTPSLKTQLTAFEAL